MSLPGTKVTVEVLKDGRWAQEPWLPQLQVVKGDRVSISISFANSLQKKGKCKIISSADEIESTEVKPDTEVTEATEVKPDNDVLKESTEKLTTQKTKSKFKKRG